MRKITAILLALVLACTALVIVPAAAGTNEELDIKFTEKAPRLDGVISANEYGKNSLLSWSIGDGATNGWNLGCYEITDDPNLQIDFYATWTKTDLYLAWKVKTKYDCRIKDDETDNWMYEYCCVQFIITPGAPDNTVKKYQTFEWSGDYLEIGICKRSDGQTYKVSWSQPAKAKDGLKTTDWEAIAVRDEAKQTTVYECRIPFNKSGLDMVGDTAQFGLTFAVGAQEHYDNVKHGLVEYCDAIVGSKNADNSAIITLTGSGEGPKENETVVAGSKDDCKDGELPAGLESANLTIDELNKAITTDLSSLITDIKNLASYNTKYAQCVLLRPDKAYPAFDGYYTVMENKFGGGADVAFETELKEGDLVLLVHGDEGDGKVRRDEAAAMVAGQKAYLFGFAKDKDGSIAWKYKNAQLIPIKDPADMLVGKWTSESETIIFNADKKTGTRGETAFEWSMDDKKVLTIDGKKVDWSIEGTTLTLGGESFGKVEKANYEALNDLITKAEAAVSTNYTEEAYAELQKLADEAKALVEADLYADEQDKIDAAADALNAALDNVKPTESVSSESQTSEPETTESEPEKKDDGGNMTLIIILIIVGVVVVAGAVVAVVLVKKKKK